MKLLLTGDLHLTDKAPKKRTDDFVKAQRNKMSQILDIFTEQNCACILQPGDFFDSHRASDYIKQYWMHIFKDGDIVFYCVFGQHDLRYHTSNIDNTPIKVLTRTGNVHILRNNLVYHPILLNHIKTIDETYDIYGQSWHEQTPRIVHPDKFNILVIHKQFYTSKIDFPGQDKEGTNATTFLKKHPFDLVVAGDNHRFFRATYEGRQLINLGSLMRTKIDQVNHKPRIALFDTETKELKIIKLKVKPFEQVFNMEQEKVEEERSKSLQNFIKEIKSTSKSKKLNFVAKLKEARDNTEEGIATIIDEVMQRAELKWK